MREEDTGVPRDMHTHSLIVGRIRMSLEESKTQVNNNRHQGPLGPLPLMEGSLGARSEVKGGILSPPPAGATPRATLTFP